MTDDLIARLRATYSNQAPLYQDAADALEAQARRIAELEAALQPFAEMTRYCYDKGDDEQLCVVVSDLRAACEAMERKND